MGGSICELLCRLGLPELNIWDMDIVSSHNLGNQIYRTKDINALKENAITDILKDINPDIKVNAHGKVDTDSEIAGYIFLCIDNIDVRRELCKKWQYNPDILFITDGRMGLTEGTIYAADWLSYIEQVNFIKSMNYSHEEAIAATPRSACGLAYSLVCTPRMLASLMVANFIKFINTNEYNKFMQIDAYNAFIDAYKAK